MNEEMEKMADVDKKIMEIKEMNRFLIQKQYVCGPSIQHKHLSVIKRIEDHRKRCTTNLKNIKMKYDICTALQDKDLMLFQMTMMKN